MSWCSRFVTVLLRGMRASKVKEIQHYTSYALAAGVPLALVAGAPVSGALDAALGVIIPLHAHVGLRSIIVDYAPHMGIKSDAGRDGALFGLAIVTVLTTFGLMKLNFGDIGVSGAVKALWIKQQKKEKDEKAK